MEIKELPKNKNPIYLFGLMLAKARLLFLEGLNAPHLKIRYLHDKTYARGGAYKNWTDKKYSSAIHRTVFVTIIVSVLATQTFQYFFPYFNLWNPNTARAGSNSVTWDSQADFDHNAVSGGTDGGADWETTRSSTMSVTEGGSIQIAQNTSGADDPSAWTTTSTDPIYSVKPYGKSCYPGSGVYIYFMQRYLTRYNTDTNEFTALTTSGPGLSSTTSNNITCGGNSDFIYTVQYSPTLSVRDKLYRYSISSDAWDSIALPSDFVRSYTSLHFMPSNNTVYIATDDEVTKAFYSYNVTNSQWTQLSTFPCSGDYGHNNVLTSTGQGDYLYLFKGANNIYRYSKGNNIWAQISGNIGNGYPAYPGSGDYFYQPGGTNSNAFFRFSTVTNTYQQRINSPAILGETQNGASFTWAGGDYMYATKTSDNLAHIYRYQLPLNYFNSASLGATGNGLRVSTGGNSKWNGLEWSASGVSSTYKIQLRVRTTDAWGSGTYVNPATNADSWYEITSGTSGTITLSPDLAKSSKFEIKVNLVGDGKDPTANLSLDSLKLTYDTLESPDNDDIILTKTDGTSLKSNTGTTITGGLSGAYSNETSLRVTANNLTCGGGDSGQPACATASTGLRPEVQASTASDFSSPIPATAAAGTNYADLTGLAADTPYYLRIRAIDNEGRVSGWTNYGGTTPDTADITIDQTAPAISSFTINDGAAYATSTSVTLNVVTSDTGSKLGKIYASNDGTNWTDITPTEGFTGQATYDGDIPWTISSGDATKDVYVKVEDNGGNVSGKSWTSRGDFTAGTTSTDVLTSGAQNTDDADVRLNFDLGWTGATSTTNTPTTTNDSSVWTGTEMIIWGGRVNDTAVNTGARYNPVTDTWTPISTSGAPEARYNHEAVWTGTEMIIWGGIKKYSCEDEYGNPSTCTGYLNTGARYNPISNTWTPITTTGAPTARSAHTAVWTGTEMIIWGGAGDLGILNTGARYSPVSDSWNTTATSGTPSVRINHTAVWTGTEMIIWGGEGDSYKRGDGGRYNPASNSWTAVAVASPARANHTAVWTGTEMIIWGGQASTVLLSSGQRYNPQTNVWVSTSETSAPTARTTHTAIWTGTEMIIWGGRNANFVNFNTGGLYDPVADTWISTSTTGSPTARSGHHSYWAENKMLVWGGQGGVGTGGILSSTYQSPGTIAGFTLNPAQVSKFLSIDWSGTPNGDTTIKFRTRSADTELGLAEATWSDYYTSPGSNITSGDNLWLEVELKLETSVGTETPILNDFRVDYAVKDSITLDTEPPTAFTLSSPSNPTYSATEPNPTFAWGASTGHSKYQLIINDEVNKDSIDDEATSATATNPLLEGSYSWNIKAIDGAGNETLSSNGPFTYAYDTTIPGDVTGLSAPKAQATDTTVRVSWNAATDTGSGIDHYVLERKRSDDDWSGSIYGTYVSYDVTDLYKVDTGLTVGRRYNYRIKAYDRTGLASVNHTYVDGFTTDNDNPSLVSDVNVVACDGTEGNCSNVENKGYELKVTWAKATDAGVGVTGYKVYRSLVNLSNQESDFTLVGYVDIEVPGSEAESLTYYDNDTNNDATFNDESEDTSVQNPVKASATTRLNDYATYYYRIVAIDDSANERPIIPTFPADYFTNYGSGITADVTDPAAPFGLSVTPFGIGEGTEPNNQRLDISWTAPSDTRTPGRTPIGNGSGVATYALYRAVGDINGPTGEFEAVAGAGALTSTAYEDNGLAETTYYYYKVIATDNASNASEYSDSKGALTKNSAVPSTPRSVTVTAVTGDPAAEETVGHTINLTFAGSAIKHTVNQVTGYEIYRSATNYSDEATWLSSATKVHTISDINHSGYLAGTSPVYHAGGSFSDTELDDATTYYYRVRAMGQNTEVGEVQSSLSAVTTGTLHSGWDATPDDTAPARPEGVRVKDIHGNATMYRNIITWQVIDAPTRNGSSDFARYEVYRFETSLGFSFKEKIAEKNDIGDNYHVDGIAEEAGNVDYSYYVVAVDNAGTDFKYTNSEVVINPPYSNVSDFEDPRGITPSDVTPSITSLYNVEGTDYKVRTTDVRVSSATIEWETNQATDSLVEYREAGTEDKYIAIGDTESVTSHSVAIFSLNPDTNYEYRIRSVNGLGNSVSASGDDVQSLTTKDFSIAVQNPETTTTTATINWTTPIESDSGVEYKEDTGFGSTDSQTAGDPDMVKTHEVTIKALRPNTTYTYKIRSVTADKYIAETQFLSFRTKAYDSSQFVITPNASDIAEQNITATSAKIVWETAVPTTTWVDFGGASGDYSQSAGDDNLNTVHVVELDNLTPGKTYYYRVRGIDANNIEYTSKEYSFTAVLKPEIQGLSLKIVDPYTALITFNTNVDTESSVTYGKTGKFDLKAGAGGLKRNHSISLENLEDGAGYNYIIEVRDNIGNISKTNAANFATPIDKTGAKVENLKIDMLPMGESDEYAQVIISWNTNKPTTTKIEYDEGMISGKYSKSTIEDDSLNSSHTVIIKDLNPSSTYHFRVAGKDKRGNATDSSDFNFVTPDKNKSIWQLIVRSLEETFSWVSNVGGFFKGLGKKTQ